ncbi:MAG TPA: bifunctional diaminohydroxyphosphoribosylaminopyrimidine deaminase/5-amino-6-(5-phosphoribosylamino)uracil reductase RibD [Verrucomicrobiae bacterium]|jgi:diaminohydroxyphosphoribosylaminopyrimidine deaminase/5-amino-6-(5-phosphoribosylamino)uracil reductase|nr:bifunctional diaminohydroxyphosphoribosylaminopyrimidine deaminase/5-amino-6-(5-phosphoribosylamino)uracil reductase RibD [Verrucomicrobiae bacterium]
MDCSRAGASEDERFMLEALALARRGYGRTSPNPMVGAVIVSNGKIIGSGWHHRAGEPHAEINAIRSIQGKESLRGASLYVTLEPCSTFGRTPPCTGAIRSSGIRRVVVATVDPNPKHAGAGLKILRRVGIEVVAGVCAQEAQALNEVFNHWIVQRTPCVILKSAMSLDGKIATNNGESKWITSEGSRNFSMRLRFGVDAILVGVNTIIRDDPALTLRQTGGLRIPEWKTFRRIVLDPQGRLPLTAKVVSDDNAANTTVVVSAKTPLKRIREIEKHASVIVAPLRRKSRVLELAALLRTLGAKEITSVLVEGGGETHANFLAQGLVNRVYFMIAPLVISGRRAAKSVAGDQHLNPPGGLRLQSVNWKKLGPDFLLTGLVQWSGRICSVESSKRPVKSFA